MKPHRSLSPLLRGAPAATLALMLGPVLAGLLGTALPAFGWLPALGGTRFGLDAWRALWATPGLWTSVRLSLTTGFATTAASLAVTLLFCAAWHGTPVFARMQRLLSPLLALPHVALAFGFAFLLAPSGWIVRLLSPWATGFARPPDVATVPDPWGLALAAGLLLKEVPFLLLMTLAALGQTDAERTRNLARTLGYGPIAAWAKAVLPRLYPQLRLPVLAVLAYALSVVDVALVLGPTTPPPLAVRLFRWFNDPDLSLRFAASAGAMLQLALVGGAILAWLALERLIAAAGRLWVRSGRRWRRDRWLRGLAALLTALVVAAAFAGIAGMAVWSLAGAWRFPDALPAGWTLDNWRLHGAAAGAAAGTTVLLGLAAAGLALLLALLCLEQEARFGRRPTARALWLLYLPLLAPQIAFLFGLQTLLVAAGLDGSWPALVWCHLAFVLPYAFLSLADPYRAWDERYGRTALCLGASPDRVLLAVKLPMLLRPLLTAAAVGFAVSVGLYLPTLFAGGGRFATLTTEAVALSAGGDRRVIGVYALLQTALPWLGFLLALALPGWVFRDRRALQVAV